MKRPGMLYGKIVRPSAFNATLASADTSKAKALADVTVVQDKDFIGVGRPAPGSGCKGNRIDRHGVDGTCSAIFKGSLRLFEEKRCAG